MNSGFAYVIWLMRPGKPTKQAYLESAYALRFVLSYSAYFETWDCHVKMAEPAHTEQRSAKHRRPSTYARNINVATLHQPA